MSWSLETTAMACQGALMSIRSTQDFLPFAKGGAGQRGSTTLVFPPFVKGGRGDLLRLARAERVEIPPNPPFAKGGAGWWGQANVATLVTPATPASPPHQPPRHDHGR